MYLFAPIVVLVWALVSGYSPFRAGALGIGTAMIAGLIAFRLGDFDLDDVGAVRYGALQVGQRLLMRVVSIVALGALFYFVPATVAGTAAAGLGELGTFAVALVAILILAALFGWKRTGDGLIARSEGLHPARRGLRMRRHHRRRHRAHRDRRAVLADAAHARRPASS